MARLTPERAAARIAALPEDPVWVQIDEAHDDLTTDVLRSIAMGAEGAREMAAVMMALRDPQFDPDAPWPVRFGRH